MPQIFGIGIAGSPGSSWSCSSPLRGVDEAELVAFVLLVQAAVANAPRFPYGIVVFTSAAGLTREQLLLNGIAGDLANKGATRNVPPLNLLPAAGGRVKVTMASQQVLIAASLSREQHRKRSSF